MLAWKIFHRAIDRETCLAFREKAIETADLKDGTVGGSGSGGTVDPTIRKSSVSWHLNDNDRFIEIVKGFVSQANAEFRFELDNRQEWQFTRYSCERDSMEYYGRHIDAFLGSQERTNGSRKLSVIVQLSDAWEYAGGGLRFHHVEPPNEYDLRDIGSVIVFPSFVVHEVEPIHSGQRYSLVGWRSGPSFR